MLICDGFVDEQRKRAGQRFQWLIYHSFIKLDEGKMGEFSYGPMADWTPTPSFLHTPPSVFKNPSSTRVNLILEEPERKH